MKQRPFAVRRIFGALRTVAAFVVLAAQAGVAGAGVMDAREGRSAAPHLEAQGTNLHFAHNEADCFMCRAQHLGDANPVPCGPVAVLIPVPQAIFSAALLSVAVERVSSNTSRAPPPLA